jgi:UDP-N-acetylmuramyl pentapeptide phosphotransferase/UDP-N-acetylglucosamine-1-phosphate transferase
VRITKNRYQRAAAVCLLLGAVLSVAGSSVIALPALTLGCVLGFLAYNRRGNYPR